MSSQPVVSPCERWTFQSRIKGAESECAMLKRAAAKANLIIDDLGTDIAKLRAQADELRDIGALSHLTAEALLDEAHRLDQKSMIVPDRESE